jgi:type IV pilus assembly protein PilO
MSGRQTMARKTSTRNVDVVQGVKNLGAQFQGLDTRDPSSWPAIPRYALLAVVAAVVLGLLWYFWLKGVDEELQAEQAREVTLRADYQTKLQRAVSLEELKKQRAEVIQYVTLLEKQLPSKAEMDALLSDINQAGLGRSLQFDLFRPGQLVVKDYYAELPIALKVTGRYHDIGAFTADIANLSRIVTLNNLSIAPSTDKDKVGALSLEATAKTYRYLDPEEIAAQRAAAAKSKAKK